MKVTVIESNCRIPEKIRSLMIKNSINIIKADSISTYHDSSDYLVEYDDELSESYINLLCSRATDKPALIGQTKHLIIREIGSEDIKCYYTLVQECPDYAIDNAFRQLSYDDFAARHKAYILNQYHIYDFGIWGLYLNSGRMIGFCGIDAEKHQLSYCISKSFRRQGFAYEACSFVIEHLNTEYGITDISVLVDPRNTASLKLAEKLGIKKKASTDTQSCSSDALNRKSL